MCASITAGMIIDESKLCVFTMQRSRFSSRAVNLLRSISSELRVVELDTIPDGARLQKELQERSQEVLLPQIFVRGKFIGGCLDAEALSRTGEFERLLR